MEILITEAVRGESGRLFALQDGKPFYFMEEKYPELGNLMPRDVIAREEWMNSPFANATPSANKLAETAPVFHGGKVS